MSDIVSLVRAVVQDELKKLNFGEIAEVVKTYPHAEGDTCNYECDVQIRETGTILELVPITTPHIGMVSPPVVGELVLVIYVHGDSNRPVIAGRLYSNTMNPPEYTENNWKVAAPHDDDRSISIEEDGTILVQTGDTGISMSNSGLIEIKSPEDINITVDGAATVNCSDCKIDASGNIELGASGGGVITDMTHKCYLTGAPPVGSTTVTAKG